MIYPNLGSHEKSSTSKKPCHGISIATFVIPQSRERTNEDPTNWPPMAGAPRSQRQWYLRAACNVAAVAWQETQGEFQECNVENGQ